MTLPEPMLVDTSVWVDYWNGHDSYEALRLDQAIANNDPIVLSGLIVTEILLGLRTKAEAKRIATLLNAFDQTPEFALSDYTEAARIYRVCRSRGITVRSTIDCLLAQTCLRWQLPLLSKDRGFLAIAKKSASSNAHC